MSSSPSHHWPCLRVQGSGAQQRLILDISVSPGAKRTELVGWHDGALRLRLSAPPVDGAANDALRRWLSQQLGIPQARITLIRGMTARRKQLSLDISEADIDRWLASHPALAGGGPPP